MNEHCSAFRTIATIRGLEHTDSLGSTRCRPRGPFIVKAGAKSRSRPDHDAITLVASRDFEGFFCKEIRHRKSLGYPPFALLTRIVVHVEDEE